jgi:hypothetical protein
MLHITTQFLPHSEHSMLTLHKAIRLMSYRKTIAVYCKNHTEYMNSVRGRCTELLVFKYHYTSVYKPTGLKEFT